MKYRYMMVTYDPDQSDHRDIESFLDSWGRLGWRVISFDWVHHRPSRYRALLEKVDD
jgi:hypothetical protein